ncbi:MAG: FKBP-type peptidyl-prolyl cis-trans isomerase [Bacteroidetes bacterium]|nr:FKBP-type peptidyl-prolyl cis-trans isomerase [Bacteroidota bacterium]
MKKIPSYLFIAMIMLAAVSCSNQGFKKTKSGLLYKIISDGKSPQVKKGQFLKINYSQKIVFAQKTKDSLLFSTYGGVPGYAKVDSIGPIYNPAEVFDLLHKGDSLVIVLLADTLEAKNGQLPPFIKKKDKVVISFKVLDVFDNQDLVAKDREDELQKEKGRESKAIEDYLSANKINAKKTALGTYVVVNTVGDGPAVDSGKQVSVMYTGKSFPDGKVFESNITGPRKDTMKFVVGRHTIIEGWDDGLRLFKKGGKGTLYIPAFLAYDAKPGPDNKPYENLIFDVEVVDVTDAPKETAHPGGQMPQMSPEQMKRLQEQMQRQQQGK